MILNETALVLNRNWVPVDVTTVLKALCKVYDGAARVVCPKDYSIHDFDSWASLERTEGKGQRVVRTASLQIPVPEVILLARYGKLPGRHLAFSRRNLFKRDRFTCQYCGRQPGTEELTIDHVQPRSRGGTSTWENCVLACLECNALKADRTPHEARMTLRKQPIKPEWTPRLVVGKVSYKASWEKFLSESYWNVELME